TASARSVLTKPTINRGGGYCAVSRAGWTPRRRGRHNRAKCTALRSDAMIRPTVPEDTPALLQIAQGTEVFKALEIVALQEVLDDYHAANRVLGHICVTCEREGRVIGFAYYAPAAMTDRTWYLYWIAVDRQTHARGIGSELLRHAEQDV